MIPKGSSRDSGTRMDDGLDAETWFAHVLTRTRYEATRLTLDEYRSDPRTDPMVTAGEERARERALISVVP